MVRGHPTDEELAALVAVLTAMAAGSSATSAARAESGWSAYWRSLRAPVVPGALAWRMSGRT